MSAPLYAEWKRDGLVQALKRAGVAAEVGPLADAHGDGRRRATFHARFVDGREQRRLHARARPRHRRDRRLPLVRARPRRRDSRRLDARRRPARRRQAARRPGDGNPRRARFRPARRRARPTTRPGASSPPPPKSSISRGCRSTARRLSSAAPPQVAFGAALAVPPPGGFLQATEAGEQALADGAATALQGTKRVADLFCGAGAFALRLAAKHDVFAVDSDAAAVAALQRAAGAATGLRAVARRDPRPLPPAARRRRARALRRRAVRPAARRGRSASARARRRRPAARRRRLLQRRKLRPRRAHPCRRRLRNRAGRSRLTSSAFPRMSKFSPLSGVGRPNAAEEFSGERQRRLSRSARRGSSAPPTSLVDPDLVAPYLEEPRGLFRGRALAVVRPGSTAEVSAVVASACAAAGVAIVPQGGNTGLVGGQTPDAGGRQLCCRSGASTASAKSTPTPTR